MLEHARRVANENGWAWKLFVRAAEDTGFESESFDFVTSYILLHELPGDIIKKCFAEAFRVLRPGGDLVMADQPRYQEISKLKQWRAEFFTRFGGEPYWRGACGMDLVELCRESGFSMVEGYGLGAQKQPYIVRARKPG
jgi:SAM-dependent methyltransferase